MENILKIPNKSEQSKYWKHYLKELEFTNFIIAYYQK